MKLKHLLLISHLVTALVGAGSLYWLSSSLPLASALAVGSFVSGLVGLSIGMALTTRLTSGFELLERALATGDGAEIRELGIEEFDESASRLSSHIERWGEAANSSREQSREIERLVETLTRRTQVPASGATGAVLRQQLESISLAATDELNQILACTKEIERQAREIQAGANAQSDAVGKTTTYVEQMSANIDSVAENAGAALQAASSTRDSASEALTLVRELIEGMIRIRTHVEASEAKLRALGDHSHEIGSIVEMIGAISSRTDMLALNASIESVRAGEHGRGFAVVAEEVRKLAEQAAEATREVAGLIESIQLETQESIAVMAEERKEVEAEVARVNQAGEALERINQISTESASQVGEIRRATQLQLQLTQDVVLAVERIQEVARASRSRAEEACLTTTALSQVAQHFDASLKPLRDCSDVDRRAPGYAPVTSVQAPVAATVNL